MTPTAPLPIDTFEGWCVRNVSKHEYKPPIIPDIGRHKTSVRPMTKPSTFIPEAPYRMTANLRMALEAIDKGAKYTDVAALYGFSVKRLMYIKKLEKDNPNYIFHRKFIPDCGMILSDWFWLQEFHLNFVFAGDLSHKRRKREWEL